MEELNTNYMCRPYKLYADHSLAFQLQLAGFRLHPGPLPEQYRTLLNQVLSSLFSSWLGLIELIPLGNPKYCLHSLTKLSQVGSSKEKKAKNKKNKKHRGGGSETPAYEEGGRAGEEIRFFF